jgi:hypothetical protein
MLPTIQRLRRFEPLDRLAKSVEAYTSLTEQYPWIKTAVRTAVAVVMGTWTYFGESWLPFALVAALGAYISLGYWPSARRAEESAALDVPPLPSHTLDEFNLRLNQIEAALQPTESLFGFTDKDSSRFTALEKRVMELQEDINTRFVGLNERVDGQAKSQFQLAERVVTVFRAKQVQQRAEELFAKLEWVADELSAPTNDKNLDLKSFDWGKWNDKVRDWEVSLNELIMITRPYKDVRDDLLSTPAQQYRSAFWTFEEARFPDSDTIHDYKTFRLKYANLVNNKQAIKTAIAIVANV